MMDRYWLGLVGETEYELFLVENNDDQPTTYHSIMPIEFDERHLEDGRFLNFLGYYDHDEALLSGEFLEIADGADGLYVIYDHPIQKNELPSTMAWLGGMAEDGWGVGVSTYGQEIIYIHVLFFSEQDYANFVKEYGYVES